MRRRCLQPSLRVQVRAIVQLGQRLEAAPRHPGWVDDAHVVPARGQHKRGVHVGEQMQFVHRAPGGHMVAYRADGVNRALDGGQCHGFAIHRVAPAGQVVVQEQAAQILGVHAVRQACAVGVPGHQVTHRVALAQQVVAQQARPDQVVGVEPLEGPGHLRAVQIAPVPHDVFQVRDLAVVDEQRQLARLAEVGLGRDQRQAGQALVAIAGHGRRRNRQQRAAQAIPHGVHRAVRQHLTHHIERIHHAHVQVVVHRQVTVLCARVGPGHGEHRVALTHQVLDQRIVRRQVQDVVLHDPRGHDQHRLGPHLRGAGAVLDQLNEVVAVDDLTGGDGHLMPHAVSLAPGGRCTRLPALHIFKPVLQTLTQIGTAGFLGPLQHLGVAQPEVGGRDHVQHLAHREMDHCLVVWRDTAHAQAGVLPPLLGQ